jgi:hypothetical protein
MIRKFRNWLLDLRNKHPIYIGISIFIITLIIQILLQVAIKFDLFLESFWIKIERFILISFFGSVLGVYLSKRK